jgi:hypothetical protein
MCKLVLLWTMLATVALALAGCGWTDDDDDDALDGGLLATFDVVGEEFKVWVTNPTTIEQILALEAGESSANIPNGRILRGAGEDDYNTPWSWHLDPEDIEMAEMTTEVCDAAPNYVEDNVDEFVDVVQRYCPWSAELVAVEDFR